MSNTPFDWSDVDVARHLAPLVNWHSPEAAVAPVVRGVRAVSAVRAFYPERTCDFRWTSRNCKGVVEFAYCSPATDRRIMVCTRCAARGVRPEALRVKSGDAPN